MDIGNCIDACGLICDFLIPLHLDILAGICVVLLNSIWLHLELGHTWLNLRLTCIGPFCGHLALSRTNRLAWLIIQVLVWVHLCLLKTQAFNLASFYLLALGVVMRLTSLVGWITLWICGRSCLYSLHVVLLTVHCIPQNSPLAVSGLSGECDSCPNERIRSSGWFDLACFMCEKSDQLVSLIIFSTDIHSFLYFVRDKASFAPRLPGKSW